MKTSLLKHVFFALLCLLSVNLAKAQDADTDEPAPGSSITPNPAYLAEFTPTPVTPTIKSTSVIFYSDGPSVAIEFSTSGMVPQFTTVVDRNNAADTRNLNLTDGQTMLTGITSDKVYDIKATGADGRQYIVGTVNTTPFRAGESILVSDNLYRALSQFVTVERQSTPLSTYLKQLPDVSQHEKISFMQRYMMNGATLPASIKGQYPDAYVREALTTRAGGEGDCLCNFVMNQVTVVVPDETGNNDFTIGPKTSSTGPNFYNSSSYWSRGLTSMGPAKNQVLVSEGLTAGKKRRTETWESGSQTVSDNFVRIGYHLLCVGVTELPKECDCEKTVKYDFGYSTFIEARTNTGGWGCVLNQEAAAQAQDWAVAVITREKVNSVSDVQILQSGLGIATSKCSGGVPVSVLIDAAKIGVSVFQLIKSVKTAQLNDVINQTNQIIDKVGQVLTTITEPADCNNAVIDKPLVQGTASFTFHPNDPLSFMVMSGSSMEVRGLRCWTSVARIKSSFHLAGVINGGAPTPTTQHCCTNYFSNWAYASLKGDSNSRINFINGHLALNSPGGWQTVNGQPNPLNGGISIPSQVGYAIGVNLPQGQQCSKTIPIFNNPH